MSCKIDVISTYMHSTQEIHLDFVYHICWYINYIQDFGNLYKRQISTILHKFLDSKYLSYRNNHRWFDSYLFKLFDDSISLYSKQKPNHYNKNWVENLVQGK